MKTYAAKPPYLCTKKRYFTEETALAALELIHRLSLPGHQERRVYYCYGCRAWHLTSMEVAPAWAKATQRGG